MDASQRPSRCQGRGRMPVPGEEGERPVSVYAAVGAELVHFTADVRAVRLTRRGSIRLPSGAVRLAALKPARALRGLRRPDTWPGGSRFFVCALLRAGTRCSPRRSSPARISSGLGRTAVPCMSTPTASTSTWRTGTTATSAATAARRGLPPTRCRSSPAARPTSPCSGLAGQSGEPELIGHVDSRGLHPRTFALDPTGQLLVAANVAPHRGQGRCGAPGGAG
jgi:hypothetical protein